MLAQRQTSGALAQFSIKAYATFMCLKDKTKQCKIIKLTISTSSTSTPYGKS